MTRVYVYRRGEPLAPELAEALPSWRREVYDRLRNEKARGESLAAGLLYRSALGASGADAMTVPVRLLPAGKPVLDDSGLWFSLSHSDPWVCCAVSDAPVGVDVQTVRPVRESMLRRFHPDEQAWFFSLPQEERRDAFFRLWTRKEAWVKAASGERMLTLSEYCVLRDTAQWRFFDAVPADGCCLAVCTAAGQGGQKADIIPVGADALTQGLI